jgi:hypothetical protein
MLTTPQRLPSVRSRAISALGFAVCCLGCSSSVDPGGGGGGEGGGGEDAAVSVALQTRGDQVRLVAANDPLVCETAVAGPDAPPGCGQSSLELFMPAERLQVGPLILTPDMRLQVIVGSGTSTTVDCFRTILTNNPNQKIVIEDLTSETVTVRLTGFGQDLDVDGIPEGLVDGAYTGARCDLDEEPLEIPVGQFVVLPGDPAKVIGSSDGATCAAPEQFTSDCDSWRVELTLPPALLEPGTVGAVEVESSVAANMFSGDGSGSCGGGAFGGPTLISIEAASETELEFVLPNVEFGTSVPISGRYVAPICR